MIVLVPSKTLRHLVAILRWTGNLLLLAGIVCLGWTAIVTLQARLYGAYQEHRLAVALTSLRNIDAASQPVCRGDFIGQIEIPRIGIQAVVLEGADDKTLRLGVGHISGTALPGDNGNVSLAAHRDTFFRPLRRIRKNDEIRVTTFKGSHEYLVDWVRVVPPVDTHVLDPAGRPILTLVTCYPFYFVGAAPDRFIVRAHEVVD